MAHDRPIPRVHRRKQPHHRHKQPHHRHLVHNHGKKHLPRTQTQQDGPGDDPPPTTLDHGQEELYSFYAPALEAGDYDITVTQTIYSPAVGSVPAAQKDVTSKKVFRVNAPRFSLPNGEVHSTYPPQGHGDESRVLPHIVFTDPHLPWERVGDVTESSRVSNDEFARNRTPWLALLSFGDDATGQNELHLKPEQLNGPHSIFPPSMPTEQPVTQSSTYATYMYLRDLWKMPSVTTPINENQTGDPVDGDTKANIIFVSAALFTTFVTKYVDGAPVAGQTAPDVSRYKYLAHVRHINTTGMTQAGVEDDGLFSVVLGHRSGPLSITKPSTVVVHLVSIENVVGNPPEQGIVLDIKTPYVGLASLYSWSYQCLPPASLSVAEAFADVGAAVGLLHSPLPSPPSSQVPNPVLDRVTQRLQDGYSLLRYRTQSADTTVALTRGSLTPTNVPHPLSSTIGGWQMFSIFGTDLQILDHELGIMDITYSAAWQLGKTMAMADRTFAEALTRLRNAVHQGATEGTKKEILEYRYKTKEDVISTLSQTASGIQEIFRGNRQADMLSRWKRIPEPQIALSYRQSSETRQMYLRHGLATAWKLASTTDVSPSRPTEAASDGDSGPSPVPLYNEFNTPYSNDWKVLLNWVLDKMYLASIPAHYLIPDPSYLPNESLKFFHIDANWIDCFLDGAFSLANQVSRDDDEVRGIIKSILEVYTTGELSPLFGSAPQIPTFGFLMRSSLVTQFPDLVVTAPRAKGDHRAPILRQENIAKDTLLVLFDRLPSDPDFQSILISQPQHQQFFSLGATLGPDPLAQKNAAAPLELEIIYKRVYAPVVKVDPNIKDEYDKDVFKSSDSQTVFDWTNRTLIFPAFAQRVYDKISSGMNNIVPTLPDGPPAPNFTDTVGPDHKGLPSAALLGIQMNEPMYQLKIHIPEPLAASRIQLDQRGEKKEAKPQGEGYGRSVAIREKGADISGADAQRRTASKRNFPLPQPSERRRSRSTASIPLPPPHQRPHRIPMPLSPNPPKFDPEPPTTDKNFAISCHYISSYGKPVPTNIRKPMDLVFSVRLRDTYNTNWMLNYLQFEIPMETDKPHAANRLPLVQANYQDVTAVMQSNQRFNVWGPVASHENSFLNVVLQPRWFPGPVKLDLVTECSFILNQVHVVQGIRGKCRVNIIQDFSAIVGPPPEQKHAFILVSMGS